MKKINLFWVPVLFFSMVLFAQTSWAYKAYIIDSKEVPLHSAPGSKKKVLQNMTPGAAVEVLKINEWTEVRYTAESGATAEGWVRTRKLGPEPPNDVQIKQVESENSALKEKLAAIEKEKDELVQKEKALTEQLSQLQSAHEALKSGSANYIELKEEFESTKSTLTTAQENIQALIQENESLKISQRVKWFAAGALVLFLGWFIGWFTGRQQKKRRSSYFI